MVNQRIFDREVILKVEALTKNFGALVAVDNVYLEVEKGSVCSIIGPNGAGKTTLFNLIFGIFPPTSGRTYFQDRDITKLSAYEVSRLGIGRSFQGYNLFSNLTVFENVRIACQSRGNYNFNFISNVRKYRQPACRANEVLEKIGLVDQRERYTHELSHGEQRMLEVGIALAIDPILLMLDEPTSGLAPEETKKMIELIEDIKSEYTILLIEHKMMVVMSVSKKIVVLHQGKVIAEGSPKQIRNNEEVQRAYLGGYTENASGG